jgi:hypothetical protein
MNEFQLICYDHKDFFEQLLKELFMHGICCAIVGTFPAYTAGVFCSYGTATLAIAVTDIIVLDKRLQRNGSPHFSF